MRRTFLALLLVATACNRERIANTADQTSDSAERAIENLRAEAPVGPRVTREQIERERLSAQWQRLRSFQEAARRAVTGQQRPGQERVKLTFVVDPKFAEKLDPNVLQNIDPLPIRVPIRGDVSGPSVLRAQVMLDRVMYSPGAIDGRWGKNTAIAVYWFQRENGLPTTGEIDEMTFRAIARAADYPPSIIDYTLTADDARGPFTRIPEDVYDQAKLDCLCYENLSEKIAERFHMTTELMELLNPGADIDAAQPGQRLRVLNVRPPLTQGAAPPVQRLRVSVEGNYLHAFDAANRIVHHAPTTVGTKYDPSPAETLKIVGIAQNPHFHYQPKLFAEVPDYKPEANLQPGPNSPVGVVWMALSKRHYGIHGTSDPDSIGYASSHGCIRMTNWDAHDISHGVSKGTIVEFVDTRPTAPRQAGVEARRTRSERENEPPTVTAERVETDTEADAETDTQDEEEEEEEPRSEPNELKRRPGAETQSRSPGP